MSIGELIRSAPGGMLGIQSTSGGLLRQLPEPRNSTGTWGAALTSTVGNVANAAIGATASLGGGEFGQLLALQMQVQKEMAEVSMLSNISKSQHETEMAPIRNLRVG